MGRTTRWLRSLLGGKKDSKQHELQQQHSCVPSPSKSFAIDESKRFPKEKRRWSFRRSVKDYTYEVEGQAEARPSYIDLYIPETDAEQSRHAIAMAAATAAAADAALAAAQAAAAVVRLTTTGCTSDHKSNLPKQEWAAIKIQTYFRRYLAMKALRALKGLVKLQALVRGHMVRKQAAATMRCMQALVKVQARIRARRVRMSEEGQTIQRQLLERRRHHRKSNNEMEKRLDETAKIVEMDTGRPNPSPKKIKNGYLPAHKQTSEKHMPASTFSFPSLHKSSTHTSQRPTRSPPHIDQHDASPVLVSLSQSDCVTAPSISPRTFSGQHGHFEDTFSTAESSPQYFSATSKPGFQTGPFTLSQPDYFEAMSKEYSSFPNYMANTESSKAKTRSQSAPRQRPDYGERYSLLGKKRATITPPIESKTGYGSGLRMQRSSSQVGMGKNPQPNRPITPQQEADEYGNARYGAYFEFYSTRR